MGYLEELFGLGGLRALVTGGASGIGFALARALGGAGAEVTIVARDPGRLDDAVSRLAERGVRATAESADLAEAADLARVEELAAASDILVNSAGVNPRPPLADTTQADLASVLAVNLLAPYRLGQAAGPAMASRGFGRIVNVGSQQSVRAFGNSGVYGMGKAGLAGLTRSQAEAWSAKGVTANTLVPGFVATAMTQEALAIPGRAEELAARTLVGRNGVPADFETAAVFLASRASGYVTGQLVFVDGGFSAH